MLPDTWKVLIVDDDDDIHSITKLILRKIKVDNKPIEFINAYSFTEAKKAIQENKDIAMTLVDIIMEDSESGIKIVNYIRNELAISDMRIVIRTGQPGHQNEDQIFLNHEINDLRYKDQLTSNQLITCVVGAIRSFRDILTARSTQSD